MSLADEIREHGAFEKKRLQPLWDGPMSDKPNGGITFSLLCRFLNDRERFRLYVIEGLAPPERFNNKIEYGNMWHLCEEAYAAEERHFGEYVGTTLWPDNLNAYAVNLCNKFPHDKAEVWHWYQVCKLQFPIYVQHWSKSRNDSAKPLMQEVSFKVPYRLPSGRKVLLRGKWDSVDSVDGEIWLQENKSKGNIDPELIQRQLKFDLQTMLYIVALDSANEHDEKGKGLPAPQYRYGGPIAGVRYNCIRRPLSGGKHTIVRHKATKNKSEETHEQYYERLKGLIAGESEYFFYRWIVHVKKSDIELFRQTCLNPILEQLCSWWDWVNYSGERGTTDIYSSNKGVHFRMPYGVYNPLTDAKGSGARTPYDSYLDTGSKIGLSEVTNLFPELT